MLNPDLLASFRKLLDANDRFVVISHVRPDGDAYGSSLGLALGLQAAGKDVLVTNADGLSPLFNFFPAASP
jgi:bifunctional oligoribonuclease and PAP phosphatase NrnA